MELATEQADNHEHSTGGQRCEPARDAAFRADKGNRRDRAPIGQMADLRGSVSAPGLDDPGPISAAALTCPPPRRRRPRRLSHDLCLTKLVKPHDDKRSAVKLRLYFSHGAERGKSRARKGARHLDGALSEIEQILGLQD